MREPKKCFELLSRLSDGKIYPWEALKKFSKFPNRDVKRLLEQGLLKKAGPGLYLVPHKSRFGEVPPDDHSLVKAFLKSNDFLLLSVNLYNLLGLGLTQLRNETIVYNKKRYETVKLSGRDFYFRRPNNGFPNKLTPEFLLVDLVNNIKDVGESPTELKQKIVKSIKLGKFNNTLLMKVSNKYGKVGTKKFFREIADYYFKKANTEMRKRLRSKVKSQTNKAA